jgi:SAM-dependent methyltransferase
MSKTLQETAVELSKTMFVGGPVRDFELVGRLQLITLLSNGLYPWSKVLDIGCGCLRGGFWLIHFLNPGCYFGIEPNRDMLAMGLARIMDEETVRVKAPRFDHNTEFDTSVFGERFDFFLARSVWTHASKDQIRTMLDGFRRNATEEGVFLTSYLPARWLRRRDYRGDRWVGRSHESNKWGYVYHRFRWIEEECAARGLNVVELREGIYNYQIWLKITRR